MTSRRKTVKNENKKQKNEVIFENEVAKLPFKKQPIARMQLINYLLETHKGELGYSEKTIDRKFRQMIKTGDLVPLEFKDLPKYGVKETDKRLVYFITKKYFKMKEDLNKIFDYVVAGELSVKKLALEEIRRHSGEYLFDPNQLDFLASLLCLKDNDFTYDLLDTLCEYILGRDIEPSNTEKLLETLRELLKRCPGSLEHTNLRRHILWLLAYYRDYAVIEQMEKDAETLEDPNSIVSEYCNEYVAPLVEEYKLELFAFQLALKENEKASKFISKIMEASCTPKDSVKRLEKNAELDKRIKKLREERTK